MGNEKLNLQEISSTMMQLFVQDILSKNNVTKENRKPLSDDQKAQLRKVVEDLQAQVDEFVNASKKKTEQPAEEPKAPQNVTLREMLRNRQKDK
jgi:spore coat protein W